ncbi:cytochrome b/b6 domain-containing protein [Chryseobacterium suipulveris]|uniref:Cytochrome b/b6 domain-containing protein n=1 Tax=Chryseobacterium suipulveris TaxID=2929800 RepID=A0ABY4BLI6_9FLAO|nr:cytochrome b/b6 domain-containing protein [Chryseobacterium suipulveris]UOE40056.1 cytochrome b/b6 domain-containing protein [Chryseobacterium suipulveris]
MKTKVWSLATRISHWLLALGFTIAYTTGENEWQMNLHYAFGALVGGILLMRIIYGFIGPKYSNFRDFPMGISSQISFIKNYFSKNTYVGHNPMASLVMFSMMIVGILTALTGYFWANETSQFLGFTLTEDFVEESHEILAKLFLILVFSHLAGIFFDTIFHGKMGTLKSIFSGYKNVQAEEIKPNIFQNIFSIFWIGIPLVLFYLAFGLPVREGGNENESEEDEWETLLYPNGNSKKEWLSFNLKSTKNNSGNSSIDGLSNASNRRKIQQNAVLPEILETPQYEPTVNAISSSSTSRIVENPKSLKRNYRQEYRENNHEREREHDDEHEEDDD